MLDKKKEISHLSHSDQSLLDDSKKIFFTEHSLFFHAILYTIGLFILLGLIWAKFAILDEVTVATGKVIPSSKVQIIQNLEGGILSQIYVKEGDLVEKGSILLRLDDTRFRSNYREVFAKYLHLQAVNARLVAEENDAKSVTYPEIVKENAPNAMQEENKVFQQRKEEINGQLDTLKRSYALAQEELAISEPLVEEGLMSQLEIIRLRQSLNEIAGKISATRESYESKVKEEKALNQAKLSELSESLTALKDRMLRTTIASPVKGKVKKINIATIGGVIQPGMDIMEVVPIEDNLLIEAKVKPRDIAFIHPNQDATVKFTAYDYSIYGGLNGKVEYISPDSIEEKNAYKAAQDATYYKILVRTEKNALVDKHGKKLEIIPGMVCTVDILTGKKSVLDYLLKPFLKAKERALRER